jgi:hypothetical protein
MMYLSENRENGKKMKKSKGGGHRSRQRERVIRSTAEVPSRRRRECCGTELDKRETKSSTISSLSLSLSLSLSKIVCPRTIEERREKKNPPIQQM